MELSLQNSSFETMSQEEMMETDGGLSGLAEGIIVWAVGSFAYDYIIQPVIANTEAEAKAKDQNIWEYTANAYYQLGSVLWDKIFG